MSVKLNPRVHLLITIVSYTIIIIIIKFEWYFHQVQPLQTSTAYHLHWNGVNEVELMILGLDALVHHCHFTHVC